jgi:hypothetical protein
VIQLDNNKEPEKGTKNDEQGVDPVQLIIWGILLVGYGIYTTYRTLTAGIESNLLYIITPNLILTAFGVIISFVGYRREKKDKKRSQNSD